MSRLAAAVIVAITLAPCANAGGDCLAEADLVASQITGDPAARAVEDVAKGAPRLFGVYGLVLRVPGAEGVVDLSCKLLPKVTPIRGTGDDFCGNVHLEQVIAADAFAATYNAATLEAMPHLARICAPKSAAAS